MTANVRMIFESNIKLLGETSKVVLCFREQRYDKALTILADSIDLIKDVIEKIIADQAYFNLVATESLFEMLGGILEAKKNKDFIMLADLLELQLINFLIGVQELIISKEEITFDYDNYSKNISLLLTRGVGFDESFTKEIDTQALLNEGYRVEFTSCGLMTLAAENDGAKFYFHSNSLIQSEAYILAKAWYKEQKKTYILYGYGMGYHIRELITLHPSCQIEVYESDYNVLQLACAFTDACVLIEDVRIKIVFDPELQALQCRLEEIKEEEAFYIHYPSYMNIRSNQGKEFFHSQISWAKALKEL